MCQEWQEKDHEMVNKITEILKLPIPAASFGVLQNFALSGRILEKLGTHVASYWVFQEDSNNWKLFRSIPCT